VALLVLPGLPAHAQTPLSDLARRAQQLLGLPGAAPAAPAPRRPKLAAAPVPGPLADLQDDRCGRNRTLAQAARTTELERRKTEQVHVFLDSEPVTVARGIESARFEGGTLVVAVGAKGRFEEFSGPVTEVIEKTVYEGSVLGTAIVQTFTLGTNPVQAPLDVIQHTLGCTDRKMLRREVLGEDSRPTGSSHWHDVIDTVAVTVEGLGPPREFPVRTDPASGASTLRVDLLGALLDLPAGRTAVPVTVRCTNCDPGLNRAQPVTGRLLQEAVATADAAALGVAEQQRRARQAELERQAQEAQRRLAEEMARAREAERGAAEERRKREALEQQLLAEARARVQSTVAPQGLSPQAPQAAPDASAAAGPVAAPGPRGPRVALVVGNAAYADRPLRNPVNDARLMQSTLVELGFQVKLAANADRRALLDALRDFESSARDAEVALFYFAGHGAQVSGNNFLLPVGSLIQGEADVADEAIDAATVLRRIEATRARVGLVILDACRDNPYPGSTRSGGRGLARMSAPTGTIVAYATAPGSTADDGSGSHGVYTGALARHLLVPGLDIKEVFDRAAQEVERVTEGRQKPREEIGLRGRFVLREAAPVQAVAAAATVPAPSGQVGTGSVPVPTRPQEAPREVAHVELAPTRAYGGLLVAAIRPNIVYADEGRANFATEVFVAARADGRITSIRIVRPSGSRVWDDAVVRALEKTERLPPDTNGQVPPQIVREGLLLVLRPRDVVN
jgi:TonB family protein